MTIRLIYCQSLNGAIGRDNDLLFKIPADLKRFKELTKNSTVIMGHKTWLSIPEKFRPLPNRLNIVLSRDLDVKYPGVHVIDSLKKALKIFREASDIWIIGGESVYREAMDYADEIYQTLVFKYEEGDVRAPDIPSDEWKLDTMSIIEEHDGLRYQFRNFSRKHHGQEADPEKARKQICISGHQVRICEGSSVCENRCEVGHQALCLRGRELREAANPIGEHQAG